MELDLGKERAGKEMIPKHIGLGTTKTLNGMVQNRETKVAL